MGVEQAVDVGREALMMVLLISSPVLIVGLVVGVVISILQAVTQVQEQTLSFVPKIAAMLVLSGLLLPWMIMKLVEYSSRMFGAIP